MKKIMFNDKYGLTDAVLQGRKTMTRRSLTAITCNHIDWTAFSYGEMECYGDGDGGWYDIRCASRFKAGEVVAVAQSYKDLGYTKEWVKQHIKPNPNAKPTDPFEKKYPGWNNKMFVPAELNNAHRIRITDIKVVRLQDISDEDCMKEGIQWEYIDFSLSLEKVYLYDGLKRYRSLRTPRAAFADLIDKVNGKGTWDSNPYVFVYEFELLKGRSEE